MPANTINVLEKDSELKFPHIFSVEASAGSGKTYTLTLRAIQFLLSADIPFNKLTNILGITFTNNSARDMKKQILGRLKSISLTSCGSDTEMADYGDYIAHITTLRYGAIADDEVRKSENNDGDVIYGGKEVQISKISYAAENLIDIILSNYHDFRIMTIDSFTSKILKASALEIGLPPDFEISTGSSAIIDYSVEKLVESAEESVLTEFLNLLNANLTGGIDFNPVRSIKDAMKHILETESNYNSEFSLDFSLKNKLDEAMAPAIAGLKDLLNLADGQGMDIKGNVNKETVEKIKNYLENKNYFGLVNQRICFPYKKSKQGSGSVPADYSKQWEELYDRFNGHMPDIAKLKTMPYLTLYEFFKNELKNAYNVLGLVYISDINKKLSRFVTESSVPEIYFRLGNSVYHYFIDEFQDTSRVQWQNLKPLIEESLSKNGSLFTVGDLKQALYGFRGADYRIMKSLLEDGGKSFPSLNEFKRVSLKTNFRSDKVLVDYVNYVFKSAIKERVESAGDPAGLLTYEQDVPQGGTCENTGNKGYCVTEIFKRADNLSFSVEAPEDGEPQNGLFPVNPLDLIEPRLFEILDDLVKNRNYNPGDIAILAQKNKYLNDISGRLIEKGYPVVAQSSLDIRNRKVIREIGQLLNFLNSPADDFNFGSFILGEVFENKNNRCDNKYDRKEFEKFIFENNKNGRANGSDAFLRERVKPMYNAFMEKYVNLWNECFGELFNKAGYLPVYEIILYIYDAFNIAENFSEESAYLAHFLDVIQSGGENYWSNLSDFLISMNAKSDDSLELFSIKLPEVKDALSLLTVHKAKGLQWNAVINIFFAEESYALSSKTGGVKNNKGRNKNSFAVEVKKDDGSVYLDMFYITKKMTLSPYLQSIYAESVKDENISDLNTLYVALTRAKHEMYNLIISKDECPLSAEIRGNKPTVAPRRHNGDENNNKYTEIGLECGYCEINRFS